MRIKEVSVDSLKNDYFKKRYDQTCGAVYIVKYKNGFIKIGSTSIPEERYKQLSYIATEYAGADIEKIAISNPIEEYRKLETILHRRFVEQNIRKELFKIGFQEAIQIINKEFNDFDWPKDSGFKFASVPAVVDIFRSGRMPTNEEQRQLAIIAFTDGLDAYEFDQ